MLENTNNVSSDSTAASLTKLKRARIFLLSRDLIEPESYIDDSGYLLLYMVICCLYMTLIEHSLSLQEKLIN